MRHHGFVGRGARFVGSKLSYANVMATLALFVALGGASYAVVQINGDQIKNRSIPGTKLKPHTLTASQIRGRSLLGRNLALHSVTSDELRDLVLSTKDRSKHARIAQASTDRSAHARVAQASTAPATIITLSVGQSATVIQSGPFTYSANCTADSNGQPLVAILAMSTESGSLIQTPFDSSGHPLSFGAYHLTAGQQVYASGKPTSDQWDFLINGARMLAPSGASLVVEMSYGTNLFGAQCWANGFGVT